MQISPSAQKERKMKKRNILQSFIRPACMLLLAAGTLFTACSKENDMIEEHTDKDKTQQADQGNIEFNFQFMDYGEPTDVTRAGLNAPDTISRDTVQLDNGLVAEVGCVSMPAKPMTAVQTRAISNGTYTIYALQGGTIKATFIEIGRAH